MWLHQETHSIIDLKLCLHLNLRMSPVCKQHVKVGGQLNQLRVKIYSASHVPALIRKDAVMFPQQHAWVCCVPPDYFVGQRFPEWGGASPQEEELHEGTW